MRISDWSSDVCSSDLHAAVDLDRLVGDPRQHLGRIELGRSDLAVGRQALVEAPGAREGQPVGGVDLRYHVGELEGDTLEAADLLAELLALGGVGEPVEIGRASCRERVCPYV